MPFWTSHRVPDPVPVHLAWKRRVGRLAKRSGAHEDRRVILLYHSVGSAPSAIAPAAYAEQVRWLVENASILSLEDILDPGPRSGLSAAITFDDGYRGMHDHAAPILANHGLAATVYLSTSLIDERQHRKSDVAEGLYPGDEFLCWDEVLRLRDLGWVIGSHGTDHIDLTQQAPDVVRNNVAQSRSAIERRMGAPCRHFAYTWGRFNRRVRDAVVDAGYASAAAGIHGAVDPRSDRFALPRIDVRSDYQLNDFAALLRGDWDFLRYSQALRRWLA